MSLLKFEYLKNAEMKRVVPVNGVKVVDKNGYIGEDMTEYFPHQPYMNYVNYALVLNGPNYSKMGKGQVEFIDSEYLVNIGGRDYKTCTIGGMVWLAENLDYKFEINAETHETIPVNPYSTPDTPAAWYYNRNELQYGIDGTYKCGLLYNWYAAKYLNDHKDTLIPGWHVPTTGEWNTLVSELASARPAEELKAKDKTVTDSWPSNFSGNDTYGFNALPAGRYLSTYTFDSIGTKTYFWTLTAYNPSYHSAYFIYMQSSGYTVLEEHYDNTAYQGMSIRLVKDA